MNYNPTRRNFLKHLGLAAVIPAVVPDKIGDLMLQPTSSERVLRIAHLTDIHVQPQKGAPDGLAQCLRHVQGLPDPPSVIFCGGDVISDALGASEDRLNEQWDVWQQTIRAECSLPIYHCIGNHDVWGKEPSGEVGAAKQRAMKEMGLSQPYYSFDQSGWHFIVLDSIHPIDGGWYTAKLGEAQFNWLAADLEATPILTPVMVLSHIPILTITSFLIDGQVREGHWEVPGEWMHIDAPQINTLFQKHGNVRLCVSGHMHMVDCVQYHGVTYLCNGAVSGGWWDGPYFGNYAGYAVIDLFADGSFEHTYIEYGWKPRH